MPEPTPDSAPRPDHPFRPIGVIPEGSESWFDSCELCLSFRGEHQ